MKRAVIVYKHLPHYRVEFFERLRTELEGRGVRLELIVGQPQPSDAPKNDEGGIEWASSIRNRFFKIRGKTLIWQPCFKMVRGSDLVILEQASKLLVNYPLLWPGAGRRVRVALWGHAINRNPRNRSRFGEWIKRATIRLPDWWFSYTEGTTSELISRGVDPARVTTVYNAIDTLGIIRYLENPERTASRLGQDPSRRRAAFLGSLQRDKEILFLLEAADHLREFRTDFELTIIGDGPLRDIVLQAQSRRPWLHFTGALTGERMYDEVAKADVLLNPGAVGLSVLHSFALGVPMVTRRANCHGPEIEYLVADRNGVVLPSNCSADYYARAVCSVLDDDAKLKALRLGCKQSARVYTIERMVESFAAGVTSCLET